MEVIDEKLPTLSELKSLDFGLFRTIEREELDRTLFAPGHRLLQRVYQFHTGGALDLSLRRTKGIACTSSVGELIWLEAQTAQGEAVFLGVESEYVFERTGMLVTPALVPVANERTVPVYVIMQAVLFELEPILGFEVQRLIQRVDLPKRIQSSTLTDYMALDHRGQCKVLILSSPECLDQMESEARNYCPDYLERRRDWAKQIKTSIALGLHPVKRTWSAEELAELDCGDLLAIKGGWSIDGSTYCLRGYFLLRRMGPNGFKYEVQYNMNDDELNVEFKGETIEDPQDAVIAMDAPAHEQVELDIMIGHTRIPLGELCAVQSGALIELGHHSLPMVTLCVNGEAILEGELVHFKDQLMVQVSKRLV